MNNVSLIGRLTKDVEERRTQSGTPVVSFTLAVNRRKKEDGADFIPCIAWDKAAETIAKYVHKGDLFGVTGHIQTRNYEKDGRMNYVTEVVTTSFQFLERKREMQSDSHSVQNNSNFDKSWGNTMYEVGSSDLPF
nr:MAG TPA: Single strand binding protein [Caudoviricetes sp.]